MDHLEFMKGFVRETKEKEIAANSDSSGTGRKGWAKAINITEMEVGCEPCLRER